VDSEAQSETTTQIKLSMSANFEHVFKPVDVRDMLRYGTRCAILSQNGNPGGQLRPLVRLDKT
jgi:hypothetical protein